MPSAFCDVALACNVEWKVYSLCALGIFIGGYVFWLSRDYGGGCVFDDSVSKILISDGVGFAIKRLGEGCSISGQRICCGLIHVADSVEVSLTNPFF